MLAKDPMGMSRVIFNKVMANPGYRVNVMFNPVLHNQSQVFIQVFRMYCKSMCGVDLVVPDTDLQKLLTKVELTNGSLIKVTSLERVSEIRGCKYDAVFIFDTLEDPILEDEDIPIISAACQSGKFVITRGDEDVDWN